MSLLSIDITTGQTASNKYPDWPQVSLVVVLQVIPRQYLYTNWLVPLN